MKSTLIGALALGVGAVITGPAFAQTPGVTPTEIRVGQTIAYSGPASAYGQLGKAEQAYFDSINAKGGINGRKIKFISRDDGYSPPKAVENVRRLVEEDDVALIFGNLGTPINMAIRPYVNAKKVPMLFIAAGSSAFNDPQNYPWVMGWQPNLRAEANFYAADLLKRNPNAKIGVLYQNDDFGKDMLNGLREGLGDKADKMIVTTQSFQAADPSIDSQLVLIRNANVDTLFLFTYSKQAAQAITKLADLGWKPATYLHLGAASIGATFRPAGLDRSAGIMTAGFMKDVTDPKWADDAAVKDYYEWQKANMPSADPSDSLVVSGYCFGQTLEQVLKQAGADLSRENIMKQAANLKDWRFPLMLPGGAINTSPTDYRVINYMKLQKFNGKTWDPVE
jgi:branched-chain amino acid transport system substrate-binding protein